MEHLKMYWKFFKTHIVFNFLLMYPVFVIMFGSERDFAPSYIFELFLKTAAYYLLASIPWYFLIRRLERKAEEKAKAENA